jgi:threonine/homoserine/homoserine lactone efflux protein
MHSFMEVFRLWEPLLLGATLALVPSTTLRAILADTLRNGYFRARANILFACLGLICVTYLVLGISNYYIQKTEFFAALGIFGVFVLGSVVYDLWCTTEMPEDEPLFSSRRVFFMPWFGGLQWLVALTILVPNGVFLENHLPFGRWVYGACYILAWLVTLLLLSQKYDQARFFFQGTQRVRWVFRVPSLVLGILTLQLLVRSVKLLLSGAGI